MGRYRTWLNQNFNAVLRNLPEKARPRVNKVDYIEFAILKLIYDIPRRGLRTIKESLDLLQSHDIQAISITGEVFEEDSESLIKISKLVETLSGVITEFGFNFVLSSRDLIELAKEMARRDYGQK